MKQHLTSLLAVASLLLSFSSNAQFSLQIASASNVQSGQQVCLNVTTSNFTNIVGLQFSMSYNPAMLQLTSVSNFGVPGLSTGGNFGLPIPGGAGTTAAGVLTMTWTDPQASGVTLVDGDTLFTLCFTALASSGSTQVAFTSTPTAIEVVNASLQNVPFNSVPGTISFSGGGGGGNPTGFTLTVSSASNVQSGQSVCLNVTTANFTNIVGLQFSMSYNPAQLQLTSISNFGLPGLTSGGNFGLPIPGGAGTTTAGVLTMTWTDPQASGVTLVDGDTLFTLCFTALASSGSTQVSFSSTPTAIEVVNSSLQNVPFNSVPGTVSFSGGGGGGGNPTGFTLTVSSATDVQSGQSVCLNVTTANFTNIVGLQFSMSYNPAQLQLTSISNFGLPGLTSGGNFGLPIPGGAGTTAAGVLTMTWTDPQASGVTLVNGDTLFTLCFTALASSGSSQVAFSSTPTAIEVVNSSLQNVPFNSVPGTVSFSGGGGGGGNPTGFTLTVSSAADVQSGQSVCLNVTTANFTNIVGLQFSMSYNPAQLQLTSISNFGLPGLTSGGNFGLPIPGGAGTTAAGVLTMTWTDPQASGVTLVDGDTLFTLCFTALASSGSTQVAFTSTPTAIEVVNASLQNVPFNSVPGTVSFSGGGGGNPSGFTLTVSSATNVQSGQSVCLNVTTANFTNIVGLQFSMSYNPAQLQLTSISNFGLPGLTSGGNFGLPIPGGAGTTAAGVLTMTWTDPQASGVTLVDGDTLFTLCFNALVGSGSSQVSFSGTPTAIEVVNASLQNVPFNSVPGTVTFGGGGSNPTGFTLTVANASNVQSGQTVCLNITTANFTNIVGLQFSMSYNPAMLQLTSVTNFGVPGLTAGGNFGLPIPGGAGTTAAGVLTMTWTDPQASGVTLVNGDTLFTLCFTALASSGSTQVAFSNTPTMTEVTNSALQVIPFNGVGGTVSFGGSPPPPNAVGLTISSASNVMNGQQVCLNVTGQDFSGISGLQLTINYDPAMLQYVSSGSFGITGLSASNFNTSTPGTIIVNWTNSSGQTLSNGATVFQLCFTALAGTGTSQVTFGTSSATNASGTALQVNGTSGTVNFMTLSGFNLIIGSASNVQSGQQVCLNVTTANFSSIVGMQFSITYNPALLQLSAVNNFGLSGLTSGGNFGLPIPGGAGSTSPGVITLTWTDPQAQGVTLPDGTTIFTLCFNALASTGSTQVVFSNTPTAIEITNAALQVVNFNSVPGTVSFGSPPPPPPASTTIAVGSASNVANGQQACLGITAQNFTNISSLQWTFTYNPALLQFSSASNFGLVGMTAANFTVTTPGTVTVNWTGTAQTLANGATVFQLCFTALGNTGSASVSVGTSTVTPSGGQATNITGTSGTVSFANITGFTLAVESASNLMSGQQVCLDVTAFNFNSIVGMQFSITYNPAMLQLTSVGNFGIPSLTTGGNMGLPIPGGAGMTAPGVITLTWTDPQASGVTLPAGDTLFTLCFNALVNTGSTQVGFSNTPTLIEISNASLQLVPFNSIPGTITFGATAAPPTISSPVGITNVNCFGASTGAIDITINGGSGAFTYSWNYQNITTQDLIGIPAGTYRVTVTDMGSGATTTGEYTVTGPSSGVVVNATTQQVSCAGSSNGGINLSISGGSPQYTINWCCGLPANQAMVSQLSAGSYTVTVTDALGCTETRTIEVLQVPVLQVTSLNTTAITDGNDGAISAAFTGGTLPYTFSWSGPAGFSGSMLPNLAGLSIPGEYCVTITDQLGCTDTACVVLRERLRFTDTQVTRSCGSASSGRIQLSVAGGIQPYTFVWSPGGMGGSTLNDLSAGNYGVTVTDQLGETLIGNFIVDSLPAPVINGNVTNVIGASTNTNGAITLMVSGGTPGYTFAWSNGANSPVLNNLAVGQYCVTVTDANGCSSQRCFDVEYTPSPLQVLNVQGTSPACPGSENGSIVISLEGGLGPFSFSFSDGFMQSITGSMLTRTGLAAGTYNFTVTDSQGTSANGMVTLTAPSAVSLGNVVIVHDSENSGCTGSVTLILSGGAQPYQVQWNTPNTGGPAIQNLCAGMFVATVTDANGCVYVMPVVEVNTFAISGLTVPTACPGDQTGAIDLTVTGGRDPYTYEWKNAAGDVVSNSADVSNLAPGTYTVRVTEGSGNVLTRSFTIGSQSLLVLDVEVLTNYNGFDVSCHNSADGRMEATAFNGQGNYTFEWRVNGTQVGTASPVLNNAAPGTYEIKVSDGNNCVAIETVTLTAPQPVAVTANSIAVSCTGSNDGQIFATASGGVSNLPYTYEWSNGGFGPRITFLRAGSYTVTVNDVNGCSATGTFSVTNPAPMSVTLAGTPATDGCNGSVLATVTGGNPPYRFTWSTGQITTTPLLTDLCPGDYFVQVRDSLGCSPEPNLASANVKDRRTPCLDIRTVITPDGDGLNEEFLISCVDEFRDNHLEIYNRWGQLVFEIDNYDNTWRGITRNGDELPDGPYYFVFEYTDIDNVRQQLRGSITILRN